MASWEEITETVETLKLLNDQIALAPDLESLDPELALISYAASNAQAENCQQVTCIVGGTKVGVRIGAPDFGGVF
jgi:hypothetical protein